MTAKRVASARKRKPTPLEIAEKRLKLARAMVTNVLWNFEQHPDSSDLRDAAMWNRIFERLKEVLG